MLQRIINRPRFTKRIKKYIKSLKPLSGGEWDNKDKLNKELKIKLAKQLRIYQDNRCAYCGLPLDETGKAELEHIAPKGGPIRPKYSQYAYTVYNLALACNLCNSPLKKGMIDTIVNLDKQNYRNCTFNIIHPYFDEPNSHVEFVANDRKVLIKSKTAKGKETIRVFKLDSEAHCMARARIVLYEAHKETSNIESILNNVLTYKRSSRF